MKAMLFLALLALGGPDCVQPDYRAVCPLPIDPNMVQGTLLCPFPSDTSRWTSEAGKYNREEAPYKDCEEDYPVQFSSPDPNVTITVNREAKTWTIATDLLPGLNYLPVKAVDSPEWRHALPAERWVTVVVDVNAPENTGPVLY